MWIAVEPAGLNNPQAIQQLHKDAGLDAAFCIRVDVDSSGLGFVDQRSP
jgi:hypothetical protein